MSRGKTNVQYERLGVFRDANTSIYWGLGGPTFHYKLISASGVAGSVAINRPMRRLHVYVGYSAKDNYIESGLKMEGYL